MPMHETLFIEQRPAAARPALPKQAKSTCPSWLPATVDSYFVITTRIQTIMPAKELCGISSDQYAESLCTLTSSPD